MKKKISVFLIIFISILTISLNQGVFANVEFADNEVYLKSYTFEEIINEENEKEENYEIDKLVDIENMQNRVLTASTEDEEYLRAYGRTQNIYIKGDTNNEYIISKYIISPCYYEITKHDIKNNKNTVLYRSGDGYSARYATSKDNIIYIEQMPETSEALTSVTIIGFDTKTNKIVYNKNFNVDIPRDAVYNPTFTIDNKDRFYFTYNYTGIRVFDKNAKLLYDKKPITSSDGKIYEVRLHSVTPNNDGLIFSMWNIDGSYYNALQPGYQKLKSDGTFVNSEFTLFNDTSSYKRIPDWKFIDSNAKYAVDQYGRIAKFEYVTATKDIPSGVKITIIQDTKREHYDVYSSATTYNPPYVVKGNLLYILGSNNIIFVFDMNKNFERVGKYTTSIPSLYYQAQVERLAIIDNQIYVNYISYSKGKIFEKKINISDIEKIKNIVYTEHSTQSHTIKQIQDKYNACKSTFNYYQNSQFEIEPSSTAPYKAGKLKSEPIQDALNQINYYRWLYGVNAVTINESTMERNQKGAVIQAATNELTHYPKQPSDMDDAFYKEAYAGCNAGASYEGNCSYGNVSVAESISGYISDLNNVASYSYVGHRLSLLGLNMEKTSFGYCKSYTTISMHYGENINNNEKFYSYPPAGNFPMQEFVTHEYWSLTVKDNYDTSNMKIQFTYNGKTYNGDWSGKERSSIIFKLPDSLINVLGGKSRRMPKAKIGVKLSGLVDENGDNVTFSYEVNFFDINEKIIPITGISFANSSKYDYVGNSKVIQNIKVNPSNTNESYKVVWSSSDTSVATVDSNGKVTCKKVGTTKITAVVGKYTASYTLTVKEKPPFTLGDVNDDGNINTLDAVVILQYVAKKVSLDEKQLQAGDTDKNGVVNTLDAVRILQLVAKKIPTL